jgi:hypothetical protein
VEAAAHCLERQKPDGMRMKLPRPAIDLSKVTPTTPLRLDIAATVGFPDGTMSASGLRTERDRGTLRVMRVAGKDYTTLAAIETMLELCHRPASAFAKPRDRFIDMQGRRTDGSLMVITPQEALRAKLARMRESVPSKRKGAGVDKSGDK